MKSKDSILLLTKDAQCKAYYPCYGNKYYEGKTPNLDELVEKGTLFHNCFTVAPSSAMSYLGMFTMKYPYEHVMQTYVPLSKPYTGVTLFDKANEMGYETHVYWDEHWYKMAYVYTQCYGKNTEIHYLNNLRQGVGPQYRRNETLIRDDKTAQTTLEMVRNEMEKVTKSGKKLFVWFHMPHVLNGRTGYADDIDLYDQYIGMFRDYFCDENIFVSADHGNMNGVHGKLRYGFDVYDTAINIPLITPRINGMKECYALTTNKDFFDLIFNRKVIEHDVIFADSTYYAQPRRKTAVVSGKYRYIYNKETRTEELYDIEWDPNQEFNLISDYFHDTDRNQDSLSRELYFYPYWDELPAIREKLRAEKDRIWRDLTGKEKIVVKVYDLLRKNKFTHSVLSSIKACLEKKRMVENK